MDIDLRLPSGDHLKEDEESNAIDNVLEHEEKLLNDNMLEHEEKLHNGDIESEIVFDIRNEVHAEDGEDLNSPTTDVVMFNEDTILEPLFGMEFDSHGAAYSFYQEYARSMGFNTAIQNSRRSKTSREFIDAKFACSRYGTKREYEKPCTNKPRTRQSKQDASGRRSCSKTDCKASMHVKRKTDGKWVIHSFVKEHNHELLPAQAVSEQTRKMYAAMARQFAEYKNVAGLINDPKNPFDKGRNLSLEAGDLKILLDFFTQMQSENSNFFYSIDLGEDQRLKSLFWIDGKSRHDYINFNDVVSMDTTYIRNKYKMPLVLFVGVNQHYQFVLLGCALVSDESETTFSWLMQTWLKAVGGRSPKLIITDHDKSIKSVASDVFPNAHNCFCLWNILGKVSENLSHVVKRHENFVVSFEECIHRPCTNEEFERRWFEIVDEFELRENEWIQSLYEDRKQWVPTYMKDVCLAGMSVPQRSESVNSYFDKYVHKKTSVQEFLKQYEVILQDRYEEEAKADSDMWNKQPTLKSPSPLEKSVSGMYTPSVFRKFQVEVLGAIGCTPKKETEDEISITFRVHDCERNQDFTVAWNAMKLEISCLCCLFQYKGYLCRHALIVLQLHCGLSSIPPQYILNRWTKDAKSRNLVVEESDQELSRVQKFDDLCQRAMKLIGEGSLSQESYSIVCSALSEAYGKCVDANCYSKSLIEPGTSASQGLPCIDEDNPNRGLGKGNKKKNPTKKRKVNAEPEVVMTVGAQDSSQQMEKLNPRSVNLDGYFGGQQGVQGMVQLNLMAPTRDNYYANTGIGQLNSMAPSHEGYFSAPQSMHGLGQMDFFRTNFTYNIRDDPNIRTATLHDDASRHA